MRGEWQSGAARTLANGMPFIEVDTPEQAVDCSRMH